MLRTRSKRLKSALLDRAYFTALLDVIRRAALYKFHFEFEVVLLTVEHDRIIS